MSIQEDVKTKLQQKDMEYAQLLISFLQDIDDGRIADTRIKERLFEDITEWVIEEGE